MIRVALASAFAACVIGCFQSQGGAEPSAVGEAPKPVEAPPPRELPGPDAASARRFAESLEAFGAMGGGVTAEAGYRRIYTTYVEMRTAGRFADARDLVHILLSIYTRVYGQDHFETRNVRLMVKGSEHLAALPAAAQREYVATFEQGVKLGELMRQGNYPEAVKLSKQILDVRRRVLRPDDLAVDVNYYAYVLHEAGRYADAEPFYREALEICRRVVGTDHPATAAVCGNLAQNLHHQDRYAEARPFYDEAVDICIRLLGKDHPSTALAYNNLAQHLEGQGKHIEAEKILRGVLETFCQAEGNESPRALISRGNLASNLASQGRYEDAERLEREVLNSRLKPLPAAAFVLAAEHAWRQNEPDIARAYNNLAVDLDSQGRHAEAEPLHRQALAIYQAFDEQNVLAGMTCSNLAVNLDKQGKYEEAEALYPKAVQILSATKARKSRAEAKVYNNWGGNLVAQGKLAEAQALHEKALAIFRDLCGKDDPDVAASCNNLAHALTNRGRFLEAEPLFREAIAIQEKMLGAEHPYTLSARVNLAINLQQQGKSAEASQMLEAGLDLQRRLLGEGHPSTAWTYKHLIINAWARGDYEKAEALGPEAMASFEAARRLVSFGGLERVTRSEELSPLRYLAAVAARNGRPAAAWHYLETGLARGLLDDLAPRSLSAEERATEQGLILELDRLDRRLAALLAGREVSASTQEKADSVRRERDATQTKLVQLQAELATKHGVAAGQVYQLPHIQERLRADEALVTWVDIAAEPKTKDPNGEHWVCLVRQSGAPVWERLPSGSENGWTDEDDRLASQVRQALANRPDDPKAAWKELTGKLAKQRLAPVEKYLHGIRHLIVLPSTKMAAVPVEALTDRFTVTYAPSGTMFAWLREKKPQPGAKRTAPTLLALGDPAFQSPDGSKDRGSAFTPLPGTRQELVCIARVFDDPRLLMGSKASEQDLDRLAAEEGGLRKFSYLHFATHGVLDDRNPMHSALILARDELPDPVAQVRNGKEVYNGRLTAARILRHWKLDAELVTLSACDTGLGRLSGGEGYVGFSQALFLSGARSLVLSLWPVDDAATALLMTRFYENLIGTRTPSGDVIEPMPKAEALAEAKRWLRTLGPDEVRYLTRDLPKRGTPRGKLVPKDPGKAEAVPMFDHPYHWAGFILIGEPR
jgi:CHAT domain-containing protein/tetratricopeptide (TPR) repeat protein